MNATLIFRRDGVLVKDKIRNPLTGNETIHEELVPYSSLPRGINMLGIREIRPNISDKDFEIQFSVENVSMDKVTPALTGLRKGTRIERIARFLVDHKGRDYTTREIADAVEDNPSKADLANVQWEATRLIKMQRGFVTTKKNGLMAYMFA